ncbi:MAG: hypothetical protein H5T69_06155 [Chloroflexi bacterium]|nr:hypothetical protein [Chloroflexota bacterium]
MRGLRRAFGETVLVCLLVLLLAPWSVCADETTPLVIDVDVYGGVALPASEAPHSLLIQATSWARGEYFYTLTITNLTPWPLNSLYILDRYLPADPSLPEIHAPWFPEKIEPGRAASFVFYFPDGPMQDACHQIEISLADGLGFVLMDCNPPNATSVWNVPLSEEMASFLVLPSLTMAEPTGRSRLGLHVTRNSDPRIMEFVRGPAPAVVVAVGDLGWLADVKEASPETITLGRFQEGDQSLAGDPVERARAFVEAHKDGYLANPGVDYWLGWNEPVIDGIGQMEWYAAFESERIRAMAELGLKVAIGNFSTGTPEADEFGAFLPAIRVAKEYGAVLALHEYSAPTMYDGVGAGIPGLEPQPGSGALTLRYRYFYDHYLRIHDLVIPLIITEAGIDGGVLAQKGIHLGGWRDFYAGGEIDSAQAQLAAPYLEQLSWYDDQLRRDPYVLGFAVFNAGETDGRWASFDITEVLPQLSEIIATKAP